MHRDILAKILRKHAVAAVVLGLAATGCNDDLADPLVDPVGAAAANPFATAAGDRAVLVVLYEATNGSDWDESDNWLTDAPLNAWHGVETHGSGRVRSLNLSENNLAGEIPAELGKLANLDSLILWDNNLTGEIPAELGKLADLEVLDLAYNDLAGEIPSELGKLANLWLLDLRDNDLTGEIPSELGNLADLEFLWLSRNDLTGEIPSELGNLANLGVLSLHKNSLTGEIPSELGNLADLRYLHLWGNKLTGKIPPKLGKLADLWGLDLRDNDLTGEIPFELGNLAKLWDLDMRDNDLTGEIPSELGNLANLKEFDVSDNRLSGILPLAFVDFPLRELFWYGNAGLCAPGTQEFIDFTRRVRNSWGPFCHEADAEILRSVYRSTGGSGWTHAGGWRRRGPLDDWHGVETDPVLGRVVGLDLRENDLVGRFPGKLASLDSLRVLRLDGNAALTGRLPLGMTALRLRTLTYEGTAVCVPATPAFRAWLGSIPSHAGTTDCPPLTDRNVLEALFDATEGQNWRNSDNWLTDAPLDAWHGVQTNGSGRVERLRLNSNNLTGEIPVELGNLADLRRLSLIDNDLTGKIPPELGNLANLQGLWLNGNDLAGEVPPELGDLANLEWLELSNNAGMSGTLPAAWTSLELSELQLGGTGLCAPRDAAFQSWLRSIPRRRVSVCAEQVGGEARAAAYVVQAVQSLEFPVPLVAGRPGLLRVFASAPQAGGARAPAARATFYQRDGTERTIEVPSGNGTLTAEFQEGSLGASANVEVPGDVLRPGVEMVVEVDPGGVLDPGLGVPGRIPAAGRTALEVHELPSFDVTVVPFLWEADPDSSILDMTRGMTPDDALFEATRRLLPVGAMSVTVHEPVWSSSNNGFALLDETEAIRTLENGGGYWMGTMPAITPGGLGGVAYDIPSRSMFSLPDPSTIAHEFGHNMYLWHAPCGGAGGPDPSFPDRRGRIGAWGWDRRSGRLVSPGRPDLMSYCGPEWVGDYHFASSFRWRMRDEAGVAAFAGPPTRVLLLWGGADADGTPFLNPSFVVDDARASAPDGAGEWRIVGEAEDGRALFDRSFDMAETADGDGRQSFVFALPAEAGWADALARIVLTGPGGTAELDAESGPAAALLLDPATGNVRGILRDWPDAAAAQAQADAAASLPEPGLEVQVSRGVPALDAWLR